MTQPITLLHTAEFHRASFSALRDRIAPEAELVQHVRTDWLDRARKHGVRQGLIDEIADLILQAQAPSSVPAQRLAKRLPRLARSVLMHR